MPRRSGVMRWSAGIAAVALAASTQSAPAAGATAPPLRLADFAVFAFSQSDVAQEDPQVYELDPDINIRANGKWSTGGDEASDYNFAQIGRYHAKGITFMGHGTASVIFETDFGSPEVFADMVTRDADGE